MEQEFEIYETNGQFGWRLQANNGQIIAVSGESYTTKANAQKGLKAVTRAKDGFDVYQDAGMQYRWRLRSPNGQIIADSGEGYVDRTDAERGIELVKGAAKAKIHDRTGASAAAAPAPAPAP
ncbi:MAG TPA: YegP family protein, partial [Kofleriaceae bacterium]|nr:YegP family protein [Kofleriaceae bacterium]